MGWEQIAIMLAPYLVGGIASAIPGGGPEWWGGSTEWQDMRRGRNQDFYNNLMQQQNSQYTGIEALLNSIGANMEGYTSDISGLQGRLSPYEQLMRGLGDRISTYAGQFENLENQLGAQGTTQLGIMRQMNDPSSYLKYMTNLGTQSNNLVNAAYKNQLGDFEGRSADYAASAANSARQAAASQMAKSGLLNTGAALEAITGAGVNEQLAAAQNVAQQRGQMMGQTYNNLMGLGSGAYQTQASNAVQGMNALSNLFGTRADVLNQAVGSLVQTGNQYGNAANVINALINARNQQAATELGGLGMQLNSRQGMWNALLGANAQDQQYESNAIRSGGLRDFLIGLAGGGGNLAGMFGAQSRQSASASGQPPVPTGMASGGGDGDYMNALLQALGTNNSAYWSPIDFGSGSSGSWQNIGAF